jgi:hypothetical protein
VIEEGENWKIVDTHSKDRPWVREIRVRWIAGQSISQIQKSVKSLHNAAALQGISPILEISTRSTEPLGVSPSFRFQLNALSKEVRDLRRGGRSPTSILPQAETLRLMRG